MVVKHPEVETAPVELTSITAGPCFDRRMSTPATFSPTTFAARTAVARSTGVMRTDSPLPPRC
ncbi:MAG: hypothetical protein R6X05_14020, partial [Desulfobacterales bacterium]